MRLLDTLLTTLKSRCGRHAGTRTADKNRLVLPGGRGVPFVEAKSLNDVTQIAMQKVGRRRP